MSENCDCQIRFINNNIFLAYYAHNKSLRIETEGYHVASINLRNLKKEEIEKMQKFLASIINKFYSEEEDKETATCDK